MTQIVGAIFARGGSKGIPRKNLRQVGEKSLVAHSVEIGLSCSRIEHLFISTEDEEIAAEARRSGADVPFFRPAELAQDDSPEWNAWQHAVKHFADTGRSFDVLVSLPPTSPLRAVEDVDRCIDTLLANDCDGVVTVSPAKHNPYFNLVRRSDDGTVTRWSIDGQAPATRQAAPSVFELTAVAYAFRTPFILAAESMFEGRLLAVEIPEERSLDIDTELDLAVANCLWPLR